LATEQPTDGAWRALLRQRLSARAARTWVAGRRDAWTLVELGEVVAETRAREAARATTAAAEERRGLPGLGQWPAAALDALGGEIEAAPAPAIDSPGTPSAREVVARARSAMLRAEAAHRLESALFEAIARRGEDPRYRNVRPLLGGRLGDENARLVAVALGHRLTLTADGPPASFLDAIERRAPRTGDRDRHELTILRATHLSLRSEWPSFEALVPALDEIARGGDWRAALALSRFLIMTGRIPDAVALARPRAEEALRRRDRRGLGRLLQCLGFARAQQAMPERARVLYRTALAVLRAAGETRPIAVALGNLGLVHGESGRPESAGRCHRLALRRYRECGDPRGQIACLGNLAALHQERGELDRARRDHRRALELARAHGERDFEARSNYWLSSIEMDLGRVPEAFAALDEALGLHRSIGNRRGEAVALLLLGQFHRRTGSAERAAAILELALPIHRRLRTGRMEAWAVMELALARSDSREWGDVRAGLDASLGRARELGDSRLEGCALQALGAEALRNGELDEAETRAEQALALHRALGDRMQEAICLGSLAEVRLAAHQPAAARQDARQALSLLDSIGSVESALVPTQATLARAHAELGQPDAALRCFRASIEGTEGLLLEVGTDARRSRLLESVRSTVEEAVALLVSGDSPGGIREAFELAERMKGRSLLQHLRPSPSVGAVPNPTRAMREAIELRLRALQSSLMAESSRANPRAGLVDRLAAELREVRREHRDLLDEIGLRWPARAADEGLTPALSLSEVQARVLGSSDRALLHYLVSERVTYPWIVRADRLRLVRLEAGRTELEEMVARLLEPVRKAASKGAALAMLSVTPARLQAIGRHVLGPALDLLDGVARLVVVPDGPLHGLPFELLVLRLPGQRGWSDPGGRVSPYAAPEYFCERFELLYSPSATLADPGLHPTRHHQRPSRVVALADPSYEDTGPESTRLRASARGARLRNLPGTRAEVEALDEVFGGNRVDSFVGDDAREETYRNEVAGADIVHLGCHGLLDDKSPEHSGLVLSSGGAPGEDALLQAFEIAEIALPRHPLVVISACEVASGPRSAGEGLVSLTRAFVRAGARTVVASLWPIDDRASAELVTRFYRCLGPEARDPVAALAGARRELLARARAGDPSSSPCGLPAAHPFLWAGFGVWGSAE